MQLTEINHKFVVILSQVNSESSLVKSCKTIIMY